MSSTQQLILGEGAGGAPTGYQIERSLRFNSADSAYLNRTPASAGNRRTFTFNAWVKRSTLGTVQQIIGQGTGVAGGGFCIYFNSNDTLRVYSGSADILITNAVFRDPSAWYMITLLVDTTQATAANRVRLFVNGVEQTYSATSYPAQNTDLTFNQALEHRISGNTSAAYLLNCYLTEVNFIDGQALTPSDFGETDSATGVWKPKKFSGTYGTNGFYLNFSDNSNTTAATLGKDSSGNGNNWTPSGFSVTAGAGNDSLVDTPTSYGSDTGAGGEVRGNYATLNPLIASLSSSTLSNGNLNIVTPSSGYGYTLGTIGMSSGKYYFEITLSTSAAQIGIDGGTQAPATSYIGGSANSYAYANDGNKYNNGSGTAYGNTYTTNDVIGVAYDADNGKVYFSKNGTFQNSGDPVAGTNAAFTGITGTMFPAVSDTSNGASGTYIANFGQRPFAYTAPSGFKALCTQNLPTPTIGATSTTQANDYFNVATWTGNDATRTITGYGFQPDFIWTKGRNVAAGHRLSDAVRGASSGTMLNLNTASTGEENTDTAITGFASDGFTMDGSNHPNVSPYTYVGWGWKANGAGSSNTAGTITSTVSANTTAGFSIVTYTGNGTTGTVGHGLGVTPSMIIVKSRSVAQRWTVFHTSTSNAYIYLNETFGSDTANANVRFGNNTSVVQPTSTLFTIGSSADVNQGTTTYVAYCFVAVAGYSAFGSYSGNNSSTDGTFVYLGFRPRFIMIKSTSAGTDWVVMDSARNTYNLADTSLYANSSSSESTIGTVNDIDFLSNGFKLRNNTGFVNASQTYIYAAFAEAPFKYSLAR